MAYDRVNWESFPSVATPLNAENLNRMDAAIASAIESIETAVEQLTSLADAFDFLELRVNTALRLTDGSTTGDAELADARIDNNGQVYESLGAAMRALQDIVTSAEYIELGLLAPSFLCPIFSELVSYQVGDLVWYRNQLYRFKFSHSAGSWNADHVDAYTLETLIKGIRQVSDTARQLAINNNSSIQVLQSDADKFRYTLYGENYEFNYLNDYAVGDYVVYEDRLYRFTSPHSAGTPWMPAIVTLASLLDLVLSGNSGSNTESGGDNVNNNGDNNGDDEWENPEPIEIIDNGQENDPLDP